MRVRLPGPRTGSGRRSALARLAAPAALALLALLCSIVPAHAGLARSGAALRSGATGSGALVGVQHGVFTLAGRPLPYFHGINYEGPSDRPWRMWQDGLFDPTLIAHDFDLIAAAGYNPVRIFIQSPLPDEVLAGDYSRLDTVVALAAARGLRLLITLNDDGDPDLRQVAHVDALIAAHLAGNPTIFGYDLRNEPSLVDVAASIYPLGTGPATTTLPLLSPALVDAYHPLVSMSTAARAQRSGQWSSGGFSQFDTRTLYYYLNALHLLDQFLADNPGYPAVQPSSYWTPFLTMANRTLATYLDMQLAAVRAADPTHLVTVGYSSRFWSALPANQALDFRSIHSYPPADFDSFHEMLRQFEVLNALAPSPLVLEEYGVSNDLNGRQAAAVREMATTLYLRTLGGGGDMKWMFNDDTVGYNAYENNLGAVDGNDVPKPTYLASAAANAYLARTPYAGGFVLQPDPVSGAGFVFVARDGLAIGGSVPYADARVSYTPDGPGVLWLDWSTPGVLRITPTGSGSLTLSLGALTGALSVTGVTTDTETETSATTNTETSATTPTVPAPSSVTVTGGLTVTLALSAGVPQTLYYRAAAVLPPPVPIDLPAPNDGSGWYMVARGHNVSPPFLAPWLALGGVSGVGLPMTEAFAYHGLPTQYFDDVALRIGPQGPTTAPIGVVALNGGKPRARELPARIPHVYDTTTGHNIHGAFLSYWRATGGLRFWGDPISEEMTEHGLLVQYFSGAEFAMTPPPHGRVILLPLGQRMWPSVRHVYGL